MLNIEYTEAEIEQPYQQFMGHPSGLVKKRLHVIYLKSLGLPHFEIARIARVSGDRVTDYLKEYAEGGLPSIGVLRIYRPVSSLLPCRDQIKAHFQKQPPHTISQASHEIEKLVGIKLSLSACRDFIRKRLGMKCRKMAAIPSKAGPDKQRLFLSGSLEPLLDEEKQGGRKVFFVDAAHFVMGALIGMLWCFGRLFPKSSGGRERYNVLGAFSFSGTDLVTTANDAYINSDTIVALLVKIKQQYPDIPLTLVMDNARYRRRIRVMDGAKALGIDLLFLPPHSPNLNLIERLWKFTKKKCLYNGFYETFSDLKAAIDDCLNKVKSAYRDQVKTLLNPKFQLFTKSASVTA